MGAPTCSPDDARTPTNHTNERTDMATISPLLQRSSEVRAVRGQGLYLFDEDERRYLDFTAGIGVVSTGHCHPRVVEAIQRQAAADPRPVHDSNIDGCPRLGSMLPDGAVPRLPATAAARSDRMSPKRLEPTTGVGMHLFIRDPRELGRHSRHDLVPNGIVDDAVGLGGRTPTEPRRRSASPNA